MTAQRFLLPAALLVLPALNAAADTGPFAGVGVGGSRVESDLSSLGALPPSGDSIASADYEEGDISWKIFAGYRLLDFFAIEVGYLDLGEADGTTCFTENPPPDSACEDRQWSVETQIDGWTVDAVGILPLGERWELFAKLGLYAWDGEVFGVDRVNAPTNRPAPPGTTVSRDDDGEDLKLGFGGDWRATDKFAIRGEFEWLDVGLVDEAWSITFSALYHF